MKNWWNDYVGLPYKLHGRDRTGLDCWGLVRLVYKEQQLIELPSFASEYSASTPAIAAEAIARCNEGWEVSETPGEGDVVLFRITGSAAHVGVLINDSEFLHAREGSDSCIEKLSSPKWKTRVEGIYKYTPSVAVNALPHALQTHRIAVTVAPGRTVASIIKDLQEQGLKTLPQNYTVFVDGIPVYEPAWDTTILQAGQVLDYRVVPRGGDTLRLIAMIAIVVIAVQFGPALAGLEAGATSAAGASFMGLTGAAAVTAATMSINMAGMLLLNAIFPVRPPEQSTPGEFRNTNIIQGGQNAANLYGSIPVVLGRVRYTPPLGAQAYTENSGDSSYLRSMVVWGYGPLQIDNISLGQVPVSSYTDIELVTLHGDSSDTAQVVDTFNNTYGRDVQQLSPNVELRHDIKKLASVTISNNVFTCTVNQQNKNKTHKLEYGDPIDELRFGTFLATNLTVQSILSDTQFTCIPTSSSNQATFANATYDDTSGKECYYSGGNPYITQTLTQSVSSIAVGLHFPQGLYGVNSEAKDFALQFKASVQYRQQTNNNSLPWNTVSNSITSKTFGLSPAYFNGVPQYRWSYITLETSGPAKLNIRTGGLTDRKMFNATSALNYSEWLDSIDNYTVRSQAPRVPSIPKNEVVLYEVCVFGDIVTDVNDLRNASKVTGCNSSVGTGIGLSASRSITIASGLSTYNSSSTYDFTDIIKYGYSNSLTFNVPVLPAGQFYEVRVRRLTSHGTNTNTILETCILNTVTGFNNTRPIVLPKDSYGNQVKLAMSAMRVRASGQLNGMIEGIAAYVQTVGEDYINGTWVSGRPIQNPAALFRHVLKHPGNAKANTILFDEAGLADWYQFCAANGYTFNKIYLESVGILDVLRDIAAAGRASPTLVDGKWSVVIDRPRSSVSQYFSPHNSWGFQGVRTFPVMPHAFRVNFNNQDKAFAPDECIVYADGYDATNATLFETLELPGVTDSSLIRKHARFHLAQIKLRPETYTLNTDIEHLVCTRGDLVRVVHDIPMWGSGSSRVATLEGYVAGSSGTKLNLYDDIELTANTNYIIRIRKQNMQFLEYRLRPVTTSGYYRQVELVTVVGSTISPYNASNDGISSGDLVLLGVLNQDSAKLIVQSIEPGQNMSATLTLVDYSPEIYDIDNQPLPEFNSNITFPHSLIRTNITYIPTISEADIISDERVMELVGPASFMYKMQVPIVPNTLANSSNQNLYAIEVELKLSTGVVWSRRTSCLLNEKYVLFSGLTEGLTYDLRARYVAAALLAGPWSEIVSHTVAGKLTPPNTPTGLTSVIAGSRIKVSWNSNTEIDIDRYELRISDSNWGDGTSHLYRGSSTEYLDSIRAIGTTTYYLKAIDYAGLYSSEATLVRSITAPSNPNLVDVDQSVLKVKSGSLELLLSWLPVVPNTDQYPIGGYEIRTVNSGWGTSTAGDKNLKYRGASASTTIPNVSNSGSTTFYLRTYDINNNYATNSLTIIHDTTRPASMSTATISVTRVGTNLKFVIGGNIPTKPADFDSYEFRILQTTSSADFWDDTYTSPKVVVSTTTEGYISLKEFTNPISTSGVTYRVVARMRDTSGNYSPQSTSLSGTSGKSAPITTIQ